VKHFLLIRQPLAIDSFKDFYTHSHLNIWPNHTLHSMVLWKEENHDLHLEPLYSSGLIPLKLPLLHFIGDLSYLPHFLCHLLNFLLYCMVLQLCQYSVSLLSSFTLTRIDISIMLALFIPEVVFPFRKVYMHFFYHPHVLMLCMTYFSSHLGFLRFSFYGNSSSSVHSFSKILNFFAYSLFPLVIDLSPLLREVDTLVDPSYFCMPSFAWGYYVFNPYASMHFSLFFSTHYLFTCSFCLVPLCVYIFLHLAHLYA